MSVALITLALAAATAGDVPASGVASAASGERRRAVVAGPALDEASRAACLAEELEGKPIDVVPPKSPFVPRSKPRVLTYHDVPQEPPCFINLFIGVEPNLVVDRATGLMWQTTASHPPVPLARVPAHVKEANRARLSGYAGWRLPTADEMATLVEQRPLGAGPGALQPIFWGRFLWLADTCPSSAVAVKKPPKGGGRWVIDTNTGSMWCEAPTLEEGRVLLVRNAGRVSRGEQSCVDVDRARFVDGVDGAHPAGAPPAPGNGPHPPRAFVTTGDEISASLRARGLQTTEKSWHCFANDFVKNDDGTVTDRATGLTWEGGVSSTMVNKDVPAYLAKHPGWRLPMAGEAATLVESVVFWRQHTRLDPAFFDGGGSIWLKETSADGRRFVFGLAGGGVFNIPFDDDENRVKLVRDVR